MRTVRTVRIVSLIACTAIVMLATSGCGGKNGKHITPIGGARGPAPGPDSGSALKPTSGPGTDSSLTGGNRAPVVPPPLITEPAPPVIVGPGGGAFSVDEYEGMQKDSVMFSGNTVYFDLDKATLKKAEHKKIDEVAAYLKSSGATANKMLVEGHCDERGTEEYNRSLGERRALAIREYLVRTGVGSERVFTRSYGEDKPADNGHNEAAWSKNRRGEFIVLKPKPLL